MDDVETRELRYFVAVAEELHFGRAAQRLGIAQPPLSRAIRLLERRMGVTLLERTSRRVHLTAPGQVLLTEARGALNAVEAAIRRTRKAARTTPHLTLALKPGGDAGLLPAILDRYAASPGAVPVDLVFSAGERAAMVRDGRADLALLHHPQNDLTGLDSDALHTQGQVVILPRGHRLIERVTVSMADLHGEPMARWPESRPSVAGHPVADSNELLHLIQTGRLIAVVPETLGEHLPPGLTSRPVPDADSVTLVLAWSQSSTSREVAAFVSAAVAT
ncbi:putative LysR-family transcriptional regulator [Actinoplanes missouriensis 431]|uniref:Putative LysR-family transcriptional regulator n=1 Tax=Actinoplanes missouriensis (strain ATCC 14538 / DSM 43046 / CBS 188.64 / JCM 3121 / NBRC 102363 / NCIMB 12654 / NRRL B-3342 / UNCC 431) TaxID=512565 RepID=I0HJL9_ACTM4|nr:LysR family transcriptional regulator [Actinoplanes missouriensis]BAL93206.1 putative LysR-family transcriptional regulator [Actinoplanes missouriensis 431]